MRPNTTCALCACGLVQDELEEFEYTWAKTEGPAQAREAEEDEKRYHELVTELQGDRERAWHIVRELSKLPEVPYRRGTFFFFFSCFVGSVVKLQAGC